MSREERVFRNRLLVTACRARRDRAVVDSLSDASVRTAAQKVNRELNHLHERAPAEVRELEAASTASTAIEARLARMVRRATQWVAAAVRDLPGAEALVRLFVLAQPHALDADEMAPCGGGNGHA